MLFYFFFFKQKTAYEMRISDWSSDVCSSDLLAKRRGARVVGLAGGTEKCQYVVKQLGFDACVDRRADDWKSQLEIATPDGIDVNFEKIGRASCRERVCQYVSISVVAVSLKKKKKLRKTINNIE